jgi:hypothetical protein
MPSTIRNSNEATSPKSQLVTNTTVAQSVRKPPAILPSLVCDLSTNSKSWVRNQLKCTKFISRFFLDIVLYHWVLDISSRLGARGSVCVCVQSIHYQSGCTHFIKYQRQTCWEPAKKKKCDTLPQPRVTSVDLLRLETTHFQKCTYMPDVSHNVIGHITYWNCSICDPDKGASYVCVYRIYIHSICKYKRAVYVYINASMYMRPHCKPLHHHSWRGYGPGFETT